MNFQQYHQTNDICNTFYKNADIRSEIIRNNTYNQDTLTYLAESIKAANCYVSSYSIDNANKSVQIQFRKTFIKKLETPDGSIELYSTFKQYMTSYFTTLAEFLKTNVFKDRFGMIYPYLMNNINMFYNLSRLGTGTVIINL